ncbi:hypothetical protein CGRA01v4_08680 [Colletotrichum graminicola]|nr:hypothetical protein CGRA01v4_08680 [Colletotrichum graminicola]
MHAIYCTRYYGKHTRTNDCNGGECKNIR